MRLQKVCIQPPIINSRSLHRNERTNAQLPRSIPIAEVAERVVILVISLVVRCRNRLRMHRLR